MSISPKTFKNQSYFVREIFDDAELHLIESMVRKLKRGRKLKPNDWQIRQLIGLTEYRDKEREFIVKHINKYNDEISELLEDSFIKGLNQADADANKLKGIGSKPNEVISKKQFAGANIGRIAIIDKAMKSEGTKALLRMYSSATAEYERIINNTIALLETGAYTLDEAIQRGVTELANKGVGFVTYDNGRKVSAGAWVEMATRTSSLDAALVAQTERNREYGYNLVVVSQHRDSSDLCRPWQGKVYNNDKTVLEKIDTKYQNITTAIAGGLYHPNCRHFQSPYDPDVQNEPEKVIDDIELYEKEQKQRYIERNIRKWKMRKATALTEKQMNKAKLKVAEWQKRNRQLVETDINLRRDYQREQI